MSAPAWMETGLEAVAFQKPSVPDERFAKVARKECKAGARIVCRGHMAGMPSVSLFLRVPPELVHRLKRLTDGNHTVAAWALLEDALHAIEEGNQSVVINMSERE